MDLCFILSALPIFIIPQYQMVAKMGLANTIFALVFPGLVSAFGVFFLRQTYMGIPNEVAEAAYLDGCRFLLSAGGGDALNELLLEDEVEDHHGQHGQQGAGHQHREVGGELAPQGGKAGGLKPTTQPRRWPL